METQNKQSTKGEVKVVESAARTARGCSDLALRVLALALTLVATILVGVDKESKVVSVTIGEAFTLHLRVTAKWQYMSSLVYFVVSNAIACSYAAASLACTTVMGNAGDHGSNAALAIDVLDMVMAGLLLSSGGASAGVGIIAQYGNSHVHWNKVCHVFTGYCHRMAVALMLSLLGSFVFLMLAVLSFAKLHKKARLLR